jgi:TPP-dependent pyruvate/acetoin dehydrogenase alpha subunit
MKTYRFRGHSRTDPAKYRPEGELDRWKQRDPLTLLGDRLIREGLTSNEQLEALRAEVQQQIDDRAAKAAQAPHPTLEETRAYVYAA